MNMRTTFIVLGILLVAALSFYLGSLYDWKGKSEILLKAEALVTIGEQEEAAALFKEYLIENPEDVEARLKYANVLKNLKEVPLAKDVLKKTLSYTGQKTRGEVLDILNWIIYCEVNDFEDSLEASLENKKYDNALCYADSLLNAIYEKVLFEDSVNVATLTYRLEKAIVKKAFCLWKVNKMDEAYYILRNLPWDVALIVKEVNIDSSSFVSACYGEFMLLLDDEASRSFEEEDFETSAIIWREAIDCNACLLGCQNSDSVSSEFALRLRYNISAALANSGKYYQALKELNLLKKVAPQYESELVNEKIQLYRLNASLADADYYFKKGQQYFDENAWKLAREAYRKGITHFKKAGSKEGICSCMYNIGVAYYNEGKYTDAYKAFCELQSKYPKYDSKSVAEYISELRTINKALGK